jgi:hypothetical protein
MNDIVSMVYTVEEVKLALDDIGELKVPEPDGMPAIFFQEVLGNHRGEGTEQGVVGFERRANATMME